MTDSSLIAYGWLLGDENGETVVMICEGRTWSFHVGTDEFRKPYASVEPAMEHFGSSLDWAYRNAADETDRIAREGYRQLTDPEPVQVGVGDYQNQNHAGFKQELNDAWVRLHHPQRAGRPR